MADIRVLLKGAFIPQFILDPISVGQVGNRTRASRTIDGSQLLLTVVFVYPIIQNVLLKSPLSLNSKLFSSQMIS